MNAEEKVTRAQTLAKMFAAYQNSKPTELTYAVYLEALSDVPTEELALVVRQCLRQPEAFPPTPGMLLEAHRRNMGLVPPADAATRAWLAVQGAIRNNPPTGLEELDPIARRVVKALGGLHTLRKSETPAWDRKDFFRMYDDLAKAYTERVRDEPELLKAPEHKRLEAKE